MANTLADFRGWTAFAALQIEYSLLQRTPDRDLLPMAKALDLAASIGNEDGVGVAVDAIERAVATAN